MTDPAASGEEAVREHHVFWMLVKGTRDHAVGRAYLAIQAALAYGAASVDVGWLAGEMMARGQRAAGPDGENIGAGGLAYFHWLYEIELTATGPADCHEYRFRRRADGKEIAARLKTGSEPRGLRFQQAHEREKRRLAERRERFLAGYRRPGPVTL